VRGWKVARDGPARGRMEGERRVRDEGLEGNGFGRTVAPGVSLFGCRGADVDAGAG